MTARQLAAGHGNVELFSGLDLVVAPGDVIGLVGANGAGKSTLLRMLAGLETARARHGVAEPAHRDRRLPAAGAGPRRPARPCATSWPGAPGSPPPSAPWTRPAAALERGERGADDAYAAALERWLGLGGADLDERAEAVAAELGLAVELDRPMTALSGGQAARAGLASLLLSRYDVLLLDEPTNDLDLAGLALLEDFVLARRAGTVLVSHDREFLDRTVDRVLELDLPQQQVHLYGGGYAGYLAEREAQRRHARAEYEEYAETKAGLEARARTQRAWMDKGVRNVRRKWRPSRTAASARSGPSPARSRRPRPGRPSG